MAKFRTRYNLYDNEPREPHNYRACDRCGNCKLRDNQPVANVLLCSIDGVEVNPMAVCDKYQK